MRFQVKVVARGRLRPMLGADHPDLLEHRERLVDGPERHAGVSFLDGQVDILGRGMPPGLFEGLEDRPALGCQRVPRPAELVPDVLVQHAGSLVRCPISNHSYSGVYHKAIASRGCNISPACRSFSTFW